jgi:hypothetical protein
MGSGQKGKLLVRGVARSVGRVDGFGRAFRILVKKDEGRDRFTVEAETLQRVSESQMASLSAKLLDALTVEMDDVVREAATGPTDQLTLRVVQPGTLPRNPLTGRVGPVLASRCKLH